MVIPFEEFTSVGANPEHAAGIHGLAEQPVENIMMSNCTVHMAADGKPDKPAMMDGIEPMQGHGFFLRNAKNISFSNVRIIGAKGEAIDTDDTVDLTIM